METTWLSVLPDDLQHAARSLRDQHVNEDAFVIGDALAALPHLERSGVVVLGGDFWKEQADGRLRPAHENWYLREEHGEPKRERLKRSITEAERALRRQSDRDLLVVLVCENAPEANSAGE